MTNLFKRLLTALLALVLAIALFPASVFAANSIFYIDSDLGDQSYVSSSSYDFKVYKPNGSHMTRETAREYDYGVEITSGNSNYCRIQLRIINGYLYLQVSPRSTKERHTIDFDVTFTSKEDSSDTETESYSIDINYDTNELDKYYFDSNNRLYVDNDDALFEFHEDLARVVFCFDNGSEFDVRLGNKLKFNVHYETPRNRDLLDKYTEGGMEFLEFPSNPTFDYTGTFTYETSVARYAYELLSDGTLLDLDATYEGASILSFKTNRLTYFVFSERELPSSGVSTTTAQKTTAQKTTVPSTTAPATTTARQTTSPSLTLPSGPVPNPETGALPASGMILLAGAVCAALFTSTRKK